MIRHTYVDYEWVEVKDPNAFCGRKNKKVWNKRLQLPRWAYILLWAFCVGLCPLAIVAPITVGFFLFMNTHDDDWVFIHNNKILSWFTKKV